jgi:hypothetical protein
MGEGVVPATVAENAEIGGAEQVGAGLEGEAVAGQRHPRHLLTVRQQSVEIHANLPALLVHMHVRRGDVGIEPVGAAFRPVRGRARRSWPLGAEQGLGHVEATGFVHAPGALHGLGMGEANVGALVVGEIEVVAAKRALDPRRHSDHRGAVDVVAHAVVHARADDRMR